MALGLDRRLGQRPYRKFSADEPPTEEVYTPLLHQACEVMINRLSREEKIADGHPAEIDSVHTMTLDVNQPGYVQMEITYIGPAEARGFPYTLHQPMIRAVLRTFWKRVTVDPPQDPELLRGQTQDKIHGGLIHFDHFEGWKYELEWEFNPPWKTQAELRAELRAEAAKKAAHDRNHSIASITSSGTSGTSRSGGTYGSSSSKDVDEKYLRSNLSRW